MNATRDPAGLADALAGYWTDSVLEIFTKAGVRRVSVDMEVAAWQVLRQGLGAEVRSLRAHGTTTSVSLASVMEKTLRAATLVVALRYATALTSAELTKRVRGHVSAHKATRAEAKLFAEMLPERSPRDSFKQLRGAECFARPRAAALPGYQWQQTPL
jgi:hypothetical protein